MRFCGQMLYRFLLFSNMIVIEDVIENGCLPLRFLIPLEFRFDFSHLLIQFLLAVSMSEGADRMDGLHF